MDITKTRRLLILGPPDSEIPQLIKDLTGNELVMPDAGDTIAGLSHTLNISNKYYKATIPIWIDEVADPDEWKETFSSPDAREVLEAVGACLVVFKKPLDNAQYTTIKSILEAVRDCIELATGQAAGWDGVSLAAAMPQNLTHSFNVEEEEWDDICAELRFEYVNLCAPIKDTSRESTGLARIREALEAHDWAASDSDSDAANESDSEQVEGSKGFAEESREAQMDFLQLISAHNEESEDAPGDSEENQVEQMEEMMRKLLAAREFGEGLSDAERKRHAKRAVDEIMKSFDSS